MQFSMTKVSVFASLILVSAFARSAGAATISWVPFDQVVNPAAVDQTGSPFEYNNRWDSSGTYLVFMNGQNPDPPNQVGEVLPSVNEVVHFQLDGLNWGYNYQLFFTVNPSSSHRVDYSTTSAADAFAGNQYVTLNSGPISQDTSYGITQAVAGPGGIIDLYFANVHSSTYYHYFTVGEIYADELSAPEPASLSLLGLAALSALRRPRRA